ncbi:hypothetical protein GGR51DRAFT_573463 [Nemania sp. FL0031]|nr:hypothetical protein GGR51DRAFT_573463 [Nemania sp. FL0031]
MSTQAKLRATDGGEINDTDTEKIYRHDNSLDSDARVSELWLWPPPCWQAYCLDHFLMECEIYHRQENEQYNILVAYSRQVFLDKQNRKKTSSTPNPTPTRRQPTRRAKENHSVLEITPPPTPSESQQPPRPKKLSITSFKPPRLEKTFMKSQEGDLFRVLTEFYEKLELEKSWEAHYRPSLENAIRETAERLRAEAGNGQDAHMNCIFDGPLEVECRYCGFVDTVQSGEAVRPRKLAAPAPMHAIKSLARSGNIKEPEVTFCGASFLVDVCSEKVMIVLVKLKGVLDLCAELFEGKGAVPSSPASLSAYLSNAELEYRDPRAMRTKRRTAELVSNREPKRRKAGIGIGV